MLTVRFVSYLGHEEKTWDPSNPEDIKSIKEFFKEKLKAGFRAFALRPDGTSRPITKFDEEEEKIVLTSEHIMMLQPARGG